MVYIHLVTSSLSSFLETQKTYGSSSKLLFIEWEKVSNLRTWFGTLLAGEVLGSEIIQQIEEHLFGEIVLVRKEMEISERQNKRRV